jgi:acyl-CoA thioesterase FadM
MIAIYALQTALALGRGALAPGLGPLDEARLSFRVTPVDCDVYGHMNNGRYLTVMDFGRWNYAQRSGLLRLFVSRSWWPVLGAATIDYRRELRLFQRYDLTTRIASWQGKWFWFEQRFLVGDTLHARAVVRGVVRHRGRSVSHEEVWEALGVAGLASPPPPGLPLDPAPAAIAEAR